MFLNREDSGEQLGRALQRYAPEHPLVLAIPRGGVQVGHQVALALGAEICPIIACKLGLPHQPEAAFGAIAEDGTRYLEEGFEDYLSSDVVDEMAMILREEIERRVGVYRQGKNLPPLKARTVIVVDDGIATGATIKAVIEMCRHQEVGKLIVAAPIASQSTVAELAKAADDVVVLDMPVQYFAVSQGYVEFENLTDEEVLAILYPTASEK
jgi:putative phosphoribosyl transferase